MKSPDFYSREKFSSFTPVQQLAAIDKLINALEINLNNPLERSRLTAHILELFPLLSYPPPEKLNLLQRELLSHPTPHQLLQHLATYHAYALRKDSQLAIRTGDGSIVTDPLLLAKAKAVTVICDNLRSVFNVGSIFRTSECLGLGSILLCGITPTPHHQNMAKTAMGTQELVSWHHRDSTESAIADCRVRGYTICALETAENSTSAFTATFKLPLALVVGNESLGISPETLQLCDTCISLPQLGWKNSLNVGVATAVTLYQIIFGES